MFGLSSYIVMSLSTAVSMTNNNGLPPQYVREDVLFGRG